MSQIRNIIINREHKWYSNISMESDPFYIAMLLLEKLSTNQKRGLEYDRLSLSGKIVEQKSNNSIGNLDIAIELLVSRNLAKIEENKVMKRYVFITDLGLSTIETYKKEV
ncbi:MAG TPA: hypothetical protein VHO94_03270 [Oscillospiraceae bacterium]|nr:hypothetical protein [Oscillospiraceae bacterium]